MTEEEISGLSALQKIIFEKIPLIDVRAPVEFAKGAIPGSVNLPIMEDEERHQVGKCYRKQGRQAAVDLGHALVSDKVKKARVEAWLSRIKQFPKTILCCSRGGLRSKISRQWILESSGISIPRVEGGYKAMRNLLINRLAPDTIQSQPIMLGGRTGTGKTILLKHLDNSIDLEHLAHHRGSSFGCFIDPQPVQVNFENGLACELIKQSGEKHRTLVFENEGTHVGRCYLPKKLSDFLRTCPLVMLEASVEERTRTIFDEYVVNGQTTYMERYGNKQGLERWFLSMQEAVARISNRLGSEKTIDVMKLLQSAHEKQQQVDTAKGHMEWIEILLRKYYDPLYDHNQKNKDRELLHTGDFGSVLSFLKSYENVNIMDGRVA